MRVTGGLGVRWTIGDVSERGFQALALSVWGAWRVFGAGAGYTICVNTIDVDEARRRTGELPEPVIWRAAGEVPRWLATRLGPGMAEGVAWKFAPLRVYEDRHELALDNDVVLWSMPRAIAAWLDDRSSRCLLAADVRCGFGQYASLCGPEPRNSGIRGLRPRWDLEAALQAILATRPSAVLTSELDEQGLQVAALSRAAAPFVVGVDEVTICSPFPPHVPHLGRAGAHFVGVNARKLPFFFAGRPATEVRAAHWDAFLPEVRRRVGRG